MADEEQNYCTICGKETAPHEDICKACEIDSGEEIQEKERKKGKRKKEK